MKPETREKKYLIKEFDRYNYKLIFWQPKNCLEMWEVQRYPDVFHPDIAICGNSRDTLKDLLQRVFDGKGLL